MTIHSRTGTESNRIQRSFKLPKLPDESRRTYTLRSGTYKQAGLTTHMSGEKAGDSGISITAFKAASGSSRHEDGSHGSQEVLKMIIVPRVSDSNRR